MNSQTSRKMIVASGMAAVLVIGVVAFALSSHHATPVTANTQTPPNAVPPPEVPAVAPSSDAAAAVAPSPDVPAVVAAVPEHAANSAAIEPKRTAALHLAKAPRSAEPPAEVVTPAAPIDETVPKSVDGVKSGDEATPPSTNSSTTSDAQSGTESTAPAAADAGSSPK
jgi:hypothetical protein